MNKTAAITLFLLPLSAAAAVQGEQPLLPVAAAETVLQPVSAEPPAMPAPSASPAPAVPAAAADGCTGIADNARRLACYDRAHGLNAPAPKSVDLAATMQNENGYRPVFAETAEDAERTPMSLLYDLDQNRGDGLFTVREHNPMYLMPAWYRTSPNRSPTSPTRGTAENDVHQQQRRMETKLQISFKTKVLEDLFASRADLWFGYTQQSNWQVYNRGKKSAPFRNSDYSPEIFLTQPVAAKLPFGGRLRMLGAGFIHQSNGQSRPLSRSWNRIYGMAGMEWGKLSVIPRLWVRLDTAGDKDDNPDITHYMGYGDLKLAYQFNKKHSLSALVRYNPRYHKGALQLDYIFPIAGKLKGFVQGFYGYGESLIDYNRKQKAIGLGIMFKDWDGL